MIEQKQTLQTPQIPQKKSTRTTSQRVDELSVRIDELEAHIDEVINSCLQTCSVLREEVQLLLSEQRDVIMQVRKSVNIESKKKKMKCVEALRILVGE